MPRSLKMLSCAALLAMTSAPALAGAGPDLQLELIADVGGGALYATHAPGDSERLFVVERNGNIRIIKNGSLLAAPFLTIPGVDTFFEGGFLGMAFHPEYETNGHFYVCYTSDGTGGNSLTINVVRYTVTADPDLANAMSPLPLLSIGQSNGNHNGGWIGFSPVDHMLYIAIGDDAISSTAQNMSDPRGSILRIDPDADDFPADATRNYAIPDDNPFVGLGGAEEIWSYGLRNPYRCAFDRVTGDLYIADVGQSAREEVDVQPASSIGGENYGWSCKEGTICGFGGCCNDPGFTDPVYEYDHTQGCSITGGPVYRGCAIPELDGTYFFADFCGGGASHFTYDGTNVNGLVFKDATLNPFSNISGFGEDFFGEVYVLSINGNVHKIIPTVAPEDTDMNGVPDTCEVMNDCFYDTNNDGLVDIIDFGAFGTAFGSMLGDPNFDAALDSNGDDLIDIIDFGLFGMEFNRTDCLP